MVGRAGLEPAFLISLNTRKRIFELSPEVTTILPFAEGHILADYCSVRFSVRIR